jgi:UDP-glucose 4-epimerase
LSILVTGGAGFIGSNLVEDLLTSGDEVVVVDDMGTGSMLNLKDLNGSLKVIQARCTDIPGLGLEPDAIYHLGIPSSSPMYKRDPYLVGEAINGSIAVFELARRTGSRVVYVSSSSLYSGLIPPHREDMEILVTDYYTEARLAVERMSELYSRLYGVRSIGLRLFSVYGPKEQSKKQYANIISQFMWQIGKGNSPLIYGDGSQSRDFIYVKDVIESFKLAMKSSYEGTLNVGTGRSHSFNQIIELLKEILGSEVQPSYSDNPIKNYVLHTQADTSKAEKILGFRSRYSLEEGISLLASHYTDKKII